MLLLTPVIWMLCLADVSVGEPQPVATFGDLMRGLKSDDPQARREAGDALRRSRSEFIVEVHKLIAERRHEPQSAKQIVSAMLALGDIKSRQSIPVLIENLTFEVQGDSFGASRRFFVTRPAVGGLCRIGLPAVPPVTRTAAQTDDATVHEFASGVLICTLGRDLATWYLQSHAGSATNANQRQRLELVARRLQAPPRRRRVEEPTQSGKTRTCSPPDCLAAAPAEGIRLCSLSQEPLLTTQGPLPTAHDLAAMLRSPNQNTQIGVLRLLELQRTGIAFNCYMSIRWRDDKLAHEGEILDAIRLLVDLQIDEAGPALVECLGYSPSPAGVTPGEPFSDMPVVAALIRLGLSSVAAVLKEVAKKEDKVLWERGAIVVDEVLGTQFAIPYVKDHLGRETDPVKQQRLARLLDQIDKVERHRKNKPFRSPLEEPLFPASAAK